MTSLPCSRRRAGAAAVVFALALLACGSSGSSSPPPAGAPTVTGVSPASGPARGGTALTITGTGFAAGATVKIGDVVVAGAVVAGATSITCTTPTHPAGSAAVVVTNPDGQASSAAVSFGFVAAPIVGSLVPASGPAAGGTVVTLSGSGFLPGVRVAFDGAPATVASVTSSALTLVTPQGTPGVAAVTVTNADGQSDELLAAYAYVAPPSITALAPASGPAAGGTSVTVTGSDFRPGVTVSVDGNAVLVSGLTSTSLTIVTPQGIAGPAVLTVTNPDAQSASATFTYVAPPLISALAPASGPSAGGTVVQVTGTGFQQGATATVGGAAAAVSSVTATTLTLVTPRGAPGPATVVVTNPDGQSGRSTGGYGYIAPPALTGLAPGSGPLAGGSAVVITGAGFQAGLTVSFGGFSAAIVSVTATSLTVTTPAHAAGPVDVVVTNPDGQSTTAAVAFTYRPAPAVASVAPPSGPARGGTTLTVTGAGFVPGATVTVGGVNAAGVVVASPTTITCTTPAHGGGAAPIVVTNSDGQASGPATSFTFVPAPVVSSVSPGIVPTAGQAVIIDGSDFASPVVVRFGGTAAAGATLLSPTQIAAAAPAHAAGTVDVAVENPDGQVATLAAAINYSDQPPPPPTVQPPTVTGISPATGRNTGGTSATLTGTNFDGTTTVTFGGVKATVVSVSATTLGVVTPQHPDGVVDVVVGNGAGAATLASGFTYAPPPPPSLTSLTPTSGSATGGTVVTLSGTNFDQPVVDFGGATATVQAATATSVSVVSPPGIGTVALTVTNADAQSSTLPAAFTYTTPPPTLASISPAANAEGSTTPVTLTGTGFQGGAHVAFVTSGGTSFPATSVVVVSATSITAVTPALSTQTVNVVVTNPDNQSSNSVTYSFTPATAQPQPVISGVTPVSAVLTGGQAFEITGQNFFAGATVTFGGVAPPSFTVGNTGLSITGIIPASATAGSAPIVVTTVGGSSAPFPFTYTNPAPVILALSVEGAPFAGGTTVQIAGTNLSPSASITTGGVPSTSVSFDPQQGHLFFVVPPSPAGAAADRFEELVVTNPDLQSATFRSAAGLMFHRGPPPTVTGVTPSGPTNLHRPGDVITVTGTDFTADLTGPRSGLQVSVGGVTIPVDSKSPTQIVFTLPKANVFQKTSFPVQISNFDKQFTLSTDRLFFP
jgi:hypothetical protein